jgi:spore germination cell wall hydrolase CwlJ-like protein
MFGIVRAAGYAAAVVGAAFAPALADPLMAWEVEAATPTAAYTDHAAANLDGSVPEANSSAEPKTLSQDVDFSTTVAEHAVAIVPADASPLQPDVDAKQKLSSLAAMVDAYGGADLGNADMECLAGAIYFESKGEPLAGQLAVAEVIINRTKSGRYPKTLCGVVKQPSQFSFVRGGRIPAIPRNSPHWRKAVAIAHIAQNDLADSPVPTALSFHATYVSPRWKMKRIATVGNHVFYH